MKTGTKRILLGVAAVLLAGFGAVVWDFFTALRTFRIEDQIHGTFFPVSMAIERFADTNGVPPQSLDSLIPDFLPNIPTSPLVDRLEYGVVGGTNWIMNAHSTVLKPARIYSWRSDLNFTEPERAKLIKKFHNVAVFKE
jgi:hypothetical protein